MIMVVELFTSVRTVISTIKKVVKISLDAKKQFCGIFYKNIQIINI